MQKTGAEIRKKLDEFRTIVDNVRSDLTDLRFDSGADCINLDLAISEIVELQVKLCSCVYKIGNLKRLFK